jgi:hypothetical protein
MTNGDGKSDGLTVPTKPPNKAPRGAAEVAEGRSPTKGNASQQNTSRTQRRQNGVHSALDRVRQAAKRDRKAQFTALLHHVTHDRLRSAFRALRPRAAAGVDGVTWCRRLSKPAAMWLSTQMGISTSVRRHET